MQSARRGKKRSKSHSGAYLPSKKAFKILISWKIIRSGEIDPSTGDPIRHPISEVARRLGLSERRVSALLERAMRTYPMPADHEPVEVIYEDEDLIAVNKPAGVCTAPAHR